MTTWSSYSEVFESSQVLEEDQEGKCNLSRSFKKKKTNNWIMYLYATTTLHFNAWTRMEFPSSYDCLEDSKHAKDKKLQQSETFRQL